MSSSSTIYPPTKAPPPETAIRAKGACLLSLPPYSPDLNPIEMAFAKLKTPATGQSGPDHRRPLASHRRNLRPIQPRKNVKTIFRPGYGLI